MHTARTAMNQDPKVREWAENFLKTRERLGRETMSNEEFETIGGMFGLNACMTVPLKP